MSENPEEQLNESSTTAIVVIVEWNGMKPSGNWYHRLHQYGLYSRGEGSKNGEQSLYQWRASQAGEMKTESRCGIVLQEGVIVCKSMSLARDLAMWARHEGAEIVQIGNFAISEFTFSSEDAEAFELMRAKATKKGRKRIADKGMHVITCLDEVETFVEEMDSVPFNCPRCASSRIFTRMGKRAVYLAPQGGDTIVDYWYRSRFNNGRFEIPVLMEPDGKNSYPIPHLVYDSDERDKAMLPFSDGLPLAFTKKLIDDEFKMHALDVAYCVASKGIAQRMDERFGVLASYAQNGGEVYQTFVAEEDSLDMVDLVSGDPTFLKYMLGESDE